MTLAGRAGQGGADAGAAGRWRAGLIGRERDQQQVAQDQPGMGVEVGAEPGASETPITPREILSAKNRNRIIPAEYSAAIFRWELRLGVSPVLAATRPARRRLRQPPRRHGHPVHVLDQRFDRIDDHATCFLGVVAAEARGQPGIGRADAAFCKPPQRC